uniref:Uncharacterized protein n=1 Tax=Glossina palpalis gambiensis TaxID=67801 RepID=A0A1B0BTY4_9MUSC
MPLLPAGGYSGAVRVIDVNRNGTVGDYTGHGHAINEIKFHQCNLFLLLSGSKGYAIRLRNIQCHVCVPISHGSEGPRGEVISIDFDV